LRLPNCGPTEYPIAKQKQVEEGPAQQRPQFRPGENPDEDSSDHRPDDGSEPDTLDVDASNDGSEQDAQEQTERRLPRMASRSIIGP
jgi:hypothetical protein